MKKTTLTCALAFLFVFLANTIFAQFVPKAVQMNNTVIQGLTDKVEPNGWLYFKDSAALNADTYFEDYATAMGLGANDEMVKVKEWYSEGLTHIKFKQYHKSIPVKGGEYTLHLADCTVVLAHGKIVEQLNVTLPAQISEATALQIALNEIGATTYAWQDEIWEYELQEDENNPNATWLPTGELQIYGNAGVDMIASNFHLAYRFEILAIDPYASREVYVDANNGQILLNKETGFNIDGTCTTLYDGTQTIQTHERNNDFILRDNSRGDCIWTKKRGLFSWGLTSNVTDDDNSWGTSNTSATSAHWAVEQSWDYFLNTWNRNGPNGSGSQLRVYADWGVANARWDKINGKNGIWIGNDNGLNFGALDIVGHEFTHGVVSATASLGSDSGESGALNESFADIFGEAVERYVRGGPDWLGAADLGTPIRDFASPNTIGDPTAYLQVGFWDPAGEVHINAAVQNRWFNLLAVGGSQYSITVQGIGFESASAIAYNNLTGFMQSSSNYADARSGAIAAATSLFGPCSNETIQTTNAWAACLVGAIFSNPCVFTITGVSTVCSNYPNATWIANVLPGTTVTWSFPTWWNCTISGVGGRILTLNSMSPVPPISLSAQITAISSTGAKAERFIWVTSCLAPPCNGSERSSDVGTPKLAQDGTLGREVKAFPNPVTGKLTIAVTGLEGEYKIEVVSMLGIIVAYYKADGSSLEIDTVSLGSGTYVLRIKHPQYQKTISFVKL